MNRPHEHQWASLHQRVLTEWNSLDDEMLDVLSSPRLYRGKRTNEHRERSRRYRDGEYSDFDS